MSETHKVSPVIFEMVAVSLEAELRSPIMEELLRLQGIIDEQDEKLEIVRNSGFDWDYNG